MKKRAYLLLMMATACLAMPGLAIAQQCPSPGSCLEEHSNSGCDDPNCCSQVCDFDPICCKDTWDQNCVDTANAICDALCGAAAAGNCFQPNMTPGCNDQDCCDAVCAIDPFCCSDSWDFTCSFFASQQCDPGGEPGECGDPGSGNCQIANGTPACNDLECCETVCNVDPGCCLESWDILCAKTANEVCIDGCETGCPTEGIDEMEPCGDDLNDPCTGGTPETLLCGQIVCGRLHELDPDAETDRDIDAFLIQIEDTDGDGLISVELELASALPAFAYIVKDGCSSPEDAIISIDSNLCIPDDTTECIPGGQYHVIVLPGQYPDPGGQTMLCEFLDSKYTLRVTCAEGCGEICSPTSGDCFAVNPTPGCDDAECCATVCKEDPFCCQDEWDPACVDLASNFCQSEPPANDQYQDCIVIRQDDNPFTTIGATTDGPELPEGCDEGFGLEFNNDIWYSYTATCNGLANIRTCGASTFDTKLAVYDGDCIDPLGDLLACSDDSLFCAQSNLSWIELPVTCGQQLIIRVGGFDQFGGTGVLRVSCSGTECGSPCVGDLDGDDQVNGVDLGILLADWGRKTPNDLDGDGIISGTDLGILLAAWGSCTG